MTGRYLLLAGCLVGCSFDKGSLGGGDGGIVTDDGLIDSRPDTPGDTPVDASACYGSSLAMPCFVSAPSSPVTLDDVDIDTGTSGLCDDDSRNNKWCVIAGTSITISNTVHVTGSLPLVLVATTTLNVDGTLDASSALGGQIGAGSTATGCSLGTLPSDNNAGGAGGSLGGQGGDGGGTGHGTAGNTLTPSGIRGGCPGQRGGGGAGVGGDGGMGGGAVYLYADGTLTVDGTVNASGAGGQGGQSAQAGGGGAGAGGMIVLDSPSITITGQVFANGGGGGEGGRQSGSSAGDGSESTAFDMGGIGADASSTGGDGGDGSLDTTLTGADGIAGNNGGSGIPGGSGGGGGGAGIIRRLRDTAITGTNVSPPAT